MGKYDDWVLKIETFIESSVAAGASHPAVHAARHLGRDALLLLVEHAGKSKAVFRRTDSAFTFRLGRIHEKSQGRVSLDTLAGDGWIEFGVPDADSIQYVLVADLRRAIHALALGNPSVALRKPEAVMLLTEQWDSAGVRANAVLRQDYYHLSQNAWLLLGMDPRQAGTPRVTPWPFSNRETRPTRQEFDGVNVHGRVNWSLAKEPAARVGLDLSWRFHQAVWAMFFTRHASQLLPGPLLKAFHYSLATLPNYAWANFHNRPGVGFFLQHVDAYPTLRDELESWGRVFAAVDRIATQSSWGAQAQAQRCLFYKSYPTELRPTDLFSVWHLADGITPRVYELADLASQERAFVHWHQHPFNPFFNGFDMPLHMRVDRPNLGTQLYADPGRLELLPPGWGFDEDGHPRYVSRDHWQLDAQAATSSHHEG